ncbi:MAG: amidohydrolase family protein [Phycisphaerales bacterium JB050]
MVSRAARKGILSTLVMASVAGLGTTAYGASDMVVVRAGTVITVSGNEIPRGDIVIIDGKIDLIGTNLEFPKTAKVIDARDQVVMPGMINASTRLGMGRFNRNGNNSGQTAANEIELSLMDFEPLLSAGFVSAAFVPTGNGMPGRASLYRLDGPDGPELVNASVYVPISMTNPGGDKNQLRAAIRQAEGEIEKAKKAKEAFDKKQAEEAKKAEEKNGDGKNGEKKDEGEKKPAEFEPPEIPGDAQFFVEVLREEAEIPAVFEIGSASDYIHLLDALGDNAEKFGSTFSITSNSGDFKEIIGELGEREAHVILRPGISYLPSTTIRYSIPAALSAAGCTVTSVPPADFSSSYETMRMRMADLVRTGWSREDVLKSVTLNPAKLLGVDGESGSLEKGKRADLVFLNGDPLDPTASVKAVMIGGEMVWEDEK